MSAPYHFIHQKLEDVLKAFLRDGNDPGCNIYTYGEVTAYGEQIKEPFIGVRCNSSTPGVPEVQLALGWGSRQVRAEIVVRTHAEDTVNDSRTNHSNLVGVVLDNFYRQDIVDALNAQCLIIGNIGIDGIDQPDITTGIEARSYATSIVFPILCHPNPD